MENLLSLPIIMVEHYNKMIFAPFDSVMENRGEEVYFWCKVANSVNNWLQAPENKLKRICKITEILRKGNQMIDEIDDIANLQKSVPTVHRTFGIPLTINSASYARVLAFQQINSKLFENNYDDRYAEAVKICCDNLIDYHIGHGLDIHWRNNSICPTEDEYKLIVKKKSSIYKLPVKMLQLFLFNKSVDYSNIVEKLALLLHIYEDYTNLMPLQDQTVNGIFDDLTKLQFSFVVIHAINSETNKYQLLESLQNGTDNMDLKMDAIKLMEKIGSFDYTVKYLKILRNEIMDDLEKLAPNDEFLDYLSIVDIPDNI